MRDIARRRCRQRSRKILLRISAVHRLRPVDGLLGDITPLIRTLMDVDGASVILLDADAEEFFFQQASYSGTAAGGKLKNFRFPADQGAAGQVCRTGKPLIVADCARSPYALKMVDAHLEYETRNMLHVPLRIQDNIIGVLCIVNKRDGGFDAQDVELLCAVADVVALPIENARMNAALAAAYEQIRLLNQAQDQVIHHLSHEFKTPLAVLSASIRLLGRGIACPEDPKWQLLHERIERNLHRLLEIEYKLEDILRAGNDARTNSTASPVIQEAGPGNGLME